VGARLEVGLGPPPGVTGASTAGIGALGWLADRLGAANPIASAGDALGTLGWWIAAAIWAQPSPS